jgi:hypothetical protein
VARNLADQAGEVRRLLVHPDTGTLIDAASTRYRPGLPNRARILKPTDREVVDLIAADPEWQRLLGDPDTSRQPTRTPTPTSPVFPSTRSSSCAISTAASPAAGCPRAAATSTMRMSQPPPVPVLTRCGIDATGVVLVWNGRPGRQDGLRHRLTSGLTPIVD